MKIFGSVYCINGLGKKNIRFRLTHDRIQAQIIHFEQIIKRIFSKENFIDVVYVFVVALLVITDYVIFSCGL